MFLRIFVVCAFLFVSEAVFHHHIHGNHGHRNHGSHFPRYKTVIMNPAPRRQLLNEEEMDAYLGKQSEQLFALAKRINDQASRVCRWNAGTRDPAFVANSLLRSVWLEFNQNGGPNGACGRRSPGTKPDVIHDICICLTGQFLY